MLEAGQVNEAREMKGGGPLCGGSPGPWESPRRRGRQPGAAMRFELARGKAEVDWGSQTCIDRDGRKRRIRVYVLGVRDDLGLVPDLIRELVRRAAAEAAIDPDARKIPGTEAAWPRRGTSHSGPLSGQNGVLAPWVNSTKRPRA